MTLPPDEKVASPQHGKPAVSQPSLDNAGKSKQPSKGGQPSATTRRTTRSMNRTPKASAGASTAPVISPNDSPSHESIDISSGDSEVIKVPDQNTPTAAEIVDSTDDEVSSMPEDAHMFKHAASPSSPTPARHQDQPSSKTQKVSGDDFPSSGSSPPIGDLDTADNPIDTVPLEPNKQPADKADLSPRLRSADAMEYASSSRCDHTPLWAEVPVSYVPFTWPTGPRELPARHYVCPFDGCKEPVGPTASGQGYSQAALEGHLPTHGGSDGLHSLRRDIRSRVTLLREALRRNEGDEYYQSCHSSDKPNQDDSLGRQVSAIVRHLEEIKAWEVSRRRMHRNGPAEGARAASGSISDPPSRPGVMPYKGQETSRTAFPQQNDEALFRHNDYNAIMATIELDSENSLDFENSPWNFSVSPPPPVRDRSPSPVEETYVGRGTPPRAAQGDLHLHRWYRLRDAEALAKSQRDYEMYYSTTDTVAPWFQDLLQDTEDAAEEESLPEDNSKRSRDDWSWVPTVPPDETGVSMTSQEMAAAMGISLDGLPRKRARMSGPQVDDSGEDADWAGREGVPELD